MVLNRVVYQLLHRSSIPDLSDCSVPESEDLSTYRPLKYALYTRFRRLSQVDTEDLP